MDKKNKKEQGIFETVRQVNEREKKLAEEREERELKKEEKERDEYSKTLAEEKIELLKLKQGVIENSEKLEAATEEKKKYTLWQKFKNFLYHSKWWLGIASFFVIIAGFLIYDKLTTVKPDVNIMLVCDNEKLYEQIDEMGKYFDCFTDDYNKDDEKYANILYIPITDDDDVNSMGGLYESNLTKLSAQFQMGESMLVIADGKSDGLVVPKENLTDLEKIYPDNPNVRGYGFYLKGTGFAEAVGCSDEDLPDDLYMGIRKVSKTLTPEENMKENYDNAAEILEKMIKDLS